MTSRYGERGLHHQHVGALLLVERGLAQRLARVGRIHLVAGAIAELGRAVGGLAEGAVERRWRTSPRTRGWPSSMKPSPSSARADRADAAVHHVARRDDVGAGLRVDDAPPCARTSSVASLSTSSSPRAVRAGARRSGRGRCTRRRRRRRSPRARAPRPSSRRSARGTGPSGSRRRSRSASLVLGRPKRMTPPRPSDARFARLGGGGAHREAAKTPRHGADRARARRSSPKRTAGR